MRNDEPPFIYEGDWIEAPRYTRDDKDPLHHSKFFDEALESVVHRVEYGDNGPFEVRLTVHIGHSSPGWVDGYKVILERRP